MKLEKILFHTRFRDMNAEALAALMDLTRVGLREVVLTYIIPHEEVAFVPYGGYLKEHENEIRRQAADRFAPLKEVLDRNQVACTVRIEVGADNAAILSVAQQEKVDLIVTGRKKRTLLERIYVGTHILDLVRRSPVPILMHKYMAEYEVDGEVKTRINRQIFSKPMLATDWSEPSMNALNFMIALKPIVECALVAHVIGVKIAKGMNAEDLERLQQESRERLVDYAQRFRTAGMAADTFLSSGRTASEIIRLAREQNAGMIILGRTGKDWLNEYFMGGVSHKVAEISELPVLLIP